MSRPSVVSLLKLKHTEGRSFFHSKSTAKTPATQQLSRHLSPEFGAVQLEEGLAVHFRCRHPDAFDMRLDVMSKMRGVADFEHVWNRRTSAQLPDGTPIEVMSISDLVQAKKTQRDKDWPMITRIVDAHYKVNHQAPTARQIEFWIAESRSAETLLEVIQRFPDQAVSSSRAAVSAALLGDMEAIAAAVKAEEADERAADKIYWAPLRARLEQLRREHRLS